MFSLIVIEKRYQVEELADDRPGFLFTRDANGRPGRECKGIIAKFKKLYEGKYQELERDEGVIEVFFLNAEHIGGEPPVLADLLIRDK